MPNPTASKKMRKDEMQNYQELEIYRGFSIMASITEKPTIWYIDVRIGTYEGNDFILRFPSINRTFSRSDGALNCSLQMAAVAKETIDKHRQ